MLKKTFLLLSLLTLLATAPALAGRDDVVERLEKSADVLTEILNIPEGIPKDLVEKAECVIVIPSVKKFALGIGGSYGRGVMVCRQGSDFKGDWGSVAMYRLEGASFGLQLGGSATDFVLLVMNEKGVNSLVKSKVKLGADAMAAAGPKGRSAEAATDALMTAEILTYSRSKGLFAGISLKGSTLRPDNDENEDLYGREIPVKSIIVKQSVATPPEAQPLVDILQRQAPVNRSK